MPEIAPPVLVVDDNAGFREVVVPVLRDGRPGFDVYAVETGTQLVRFLSRAGRGVEVPRPTFVVLDFHLPDLNAPALLGRLAGLVDLRRLPFLVLSQADWPEDRRAVLAAGATAFAGKPPRVAGLHPTLASFCGTRVARPPTPPPRAAPQR